MPGKQTAACAGLELEATPTGARGLYFTDEFLEVTFELRNVTSKRLRGAVGVFYGFGPAGLEGKTLEVIEFDLQPKGQPGDSDIKKALRRLVGIQGNGIIGFLLPETGNELDAIEFENGKERILRASSPHSPNFHTLYTFTTMEREFHERFYARPERIMEQTNKLTRYVMVLTIVIVILTVVYIGLAAAQAVGLLPPTKVQVIP